MKISNIIEKIQQIDAEYLPVYELLWYNWLYQRVFNKIKKGNKKTIKISKELYIRKDDFLQILTEIEEKEKFKTK